jgi:hypothetical protein
MIYSIFPKHTATVYSRYPTMNTSKDEILELNKTVSSSLVVGTHNTKILLDFDLAEHSASNLAAGIVPAKYSLTMYTANANTPVDSFTYQISDVSVPWGPGLGRSTHNPKSEVGVSWTHPSSSNSVWPEAGYPGQPFGDNNTTGSFETDLTADVTTLIKAVKASAATDNGIMLSRTDIEEVDGNKYGYVNFYSAETSTVYKPRLGIHYADDTFVTGSLTALDLTAEHYVYQATNPGIYKINSTPKFRFTGRAKYPTATYTASTAALVEYLPTSSYYSLVDVRTGDTVVPFDTTYTKISCDANGNFANLKLSGIYPDRLYQFHIRVDHNGTSGYHILDDMFRVYE